MSPAVSVDYRRLPLAASPVVAGRYYRGAGWYYVAHYASEHAPGTTFRGDSVGPFRTRAAAVRAYRGMHPETEADAAIPLDDQRPRGWWVSDNPGAPHRLRRVRTDR